MASIYNVILAQSQKEAYTQGDTIDFVITNVGKAIVKNSIRLSGVIAVQKNDELLTGSEKIYYDPVLGVHSFFNNWSVQSSLKGVLENNSLYPRFVKMMRKGKKTRHQMCSQSKLVNELCAPSTKATTKLMMNPLEFCFKPDICLNRSSSDIQYTQTGDLLVSFRLENVLGGCLFGEDVDSNTTYNIVGLQLSYKTTAPSNNPTLMMVLQGMKNVITSTNAQVNITSKSNASANSVLMSFLPQNEEHNKNYNQYNLSTPPNIKSVNYSFNNTTNNYIAFTLDSLQTMIMNALDAVHTNDALMDSVNDNKNDLTLDKLFQTVSSDDKYTEPDGFMLGLDYSDSISLANSSFGVNVNSDVKTDNPYYIYCYFQTLVQM